MLDFMTVATKIPKRGVMEVYPKFLIKKSSDLMIRGSDFYAIWVEDSQLWSTDEDDAVRLVDRELDEYAKTHVEFFDGDVRVMYMRDSDTGVIDKFHKYCQKQMRDNFHMLDEKLIFSNTETKKEDYASKKLPYPLAEGDYSSFEKLISTLYTEEERQKIEWAIGSIVAGDAKKIQKFMVLYGAAGTGKSTILNIIQQLFDGYYSVFDAKALGSSSNSFALEAFKSNPLVAIQHDGDLSHIEDNTRLNSLVSHEMMTVNEKFKSTYANQFKCFLFMGTNKPVRITDGKSGLIRRLIDVSPSGNKLSSSDYRVATGRIKHELGAIAYHCQEIYLENPNLYDNYIPVSMLGASNDFYNFVLDSFYIFQKDNGTSLKAAWEMYKEYCDEAKVPYPMSRRSFQEELKNYFSTYEERSTATDGTRIRSWYGDFRIEKFETPKPDNKIEANDTTDTTLIQFEAIPSVFDNECASCTAQYAGAEEKPVNSWANVKTLLSDLDTSKLHYVRLPENHIVIDFDIPDKDGNKCYEANLREASKWPPTYAELSKSGAGIHLHYIYTGDPTKLSRIYDENIEVKVFTGNSSLRRKLSKCNRLPIATISSGLPLKGEKMIDPQIVTTERGIRTLLKRNLNKEYHASTICSMQFIEKILSDAYMSDVSYDVSDMRNAVFAFAAHSTHQADKCLKIANKLYFKSKEVSEGINVDDSEGLIFYDVEVFPNLFVVCWKLQGENNPVIKLINPSSAVIEDLINHKLVGFNCRKYDNHILHAALMGYTPEQLFHLSQSIIDEKKGFFGEAYNISYTDIYDFSAKKQSLKKWEIELGIHHQELGLPWDEPVPEELWEKVAEYCVNDVTATEAVFDHLQGDWTARKILADLAGMTVNDTTNTLSTRIIFGKEKNPRLVYTDLATGERYWAGEANSEKPSNSIINSFPGYEFRDGKNMYRGTDIGFGGYIISNPGIYTNVALLDVASLHPNSIRAMNCFGDYTKNFTDLLDIRIAIKHKDFDTAKSLMNGRVAAYLDDPSKAKQLAQALKIVINSVYGLTSANFSNPFRDPRNVNNIVALRGALFMRTLQDEVESRGFKIVAIKTDSIKIANATKDIVDYCVSFAKSYGYTFEHEATYERICQVNDADYIARYKDILWCEETYGYGPSDNKEHAGEWTATGKQFQIPFVFKELFSKEPIVFEDLCEVKSVANALYLDFNENGNDVSEQEKVVALRRKLAKSSEHFEDLCEVNSKHTELGMPKMSKFDKDLLEKWNDMDDKSIAEMIFEGHNYQFIGKVGNFTPIKAGCGGGLLLRDTGKKDVFGKIFASAEGSTGYRWMESEIVRELGKEDDIDLGYFRALADKAIDLISEFGDFEMFVSDEPFIPVAPWFVSDEDDHCPFDVR